MSSRHAKTAQPINPLLAARHSTRAFDTSVSLTDAQVTAMLEAARWAPSAGNTQPSRFIVARKESDAFKRVLGCLNPGNQGWAQHAAMLVVGVYVAENAKGPLGHAQYDLGQSMAHLTLQVLSEGLSIRQMAGFSPDAVAKEFDLPPTLVPKTVAAIGAKGDPSALPDDLRGPDDSPRERLPLDELVIAQ
ncbi:MAG TPA: nitroreductase family protein [Stackebrandtia sp.]|uniref:nitroreductase family protein n=1 Tax=Stackebrandtia sp. TaxID=2023065 RepID=UPI002D558257|nr:nitroreductase family protein [Stackebrandtia sp.]HZE42042.1 nitroreductase family protein [Stackebrandtia sp.]